MSNQYLSRFFVLIISLWVLIPINTKAADLYHIDTVGAHASVNFKIKHLGISWLTGRFDKLKGIITYDEKNPQNSEIQITVIPASINSAHALRDKHLRGKKYLHVKKYPIARFVSTRYQPTGKSTANLTGKLTIHGVTREITTKVVQTGFGDDPWGGFRRGFETSFKIKLNDFGIKHDLGPASEVLEISVYLEGIKDTSND